MSTGPAERPSPAELWHQAGGGTPDYSRERYRELLIAAGHIIPLAPGETAQSLPCGWSGPPRWSDIDPDPCRPFNDTIDDKKDPDDQP